MAKTYSGNTPGELAGWKRVGECIDDNGLLVWLVFRRPQSHSDVWANYKIVADGRAENKANYWMARNHKTQKTAFNKDFNLMKKTRPALYDQVEALLKDLENLL